MSEIDHDSALAAATARAGATPSNMRECTVEGRRYVAIEHRGRSLLISARCPHKGTPMTESTIVGDYIVCGRHCATFDLRTGAWVRGPKCADITVKPAGAGAMAPCDP